MNDSTAPVPESVDKREACYENSHRIFGSTGIAGWQYKEN
jgi:hypothetical protein